MIIKSLLFLLPTPFEVNFFYFHAICQYAKEVGRFSGEDVTQIFSKTCFLSVTSHQIFMARCFSSVFSGEEFDPPIIFEIDSVV
jgi:hypothetical protein